MTNLIDPDLPVRIARAKAQREELQLRLDGMGGPRDRYDAEQRTKRGDIQQRIDSLTDIIDALSARPNAR